MTTRAYFDTMVYDRIAKGVTPRDEIETICRALGRDELVAYPSIVDVEELLGQWEESRAEALLRLRIMRNTVGFSPMLKQPADLLREAILAYAAGREAPPVTLSAEYQVVVAEYLHAILNRDEGAHDLIPRVLAEVRAMKDDFPKWWGDARAKTHSALNWEAIPVEERRLNFPDFFASGAVGWAEDFAASLGADVADGCRARGIEGLLALRPVRLCVGASMSLVFATTFGDGIQAPLPRRGDGYDFWHAISASAADVFVTDDKPFANRLKEVPVEGFRIVGSLAELLDHLNVPTAVRTA
jgi:hypothetical protein